MGDTQKHILVAEDEKAIAKALQLKLEHEGFRVDVAPNGEEAVQMLEVGDYSLVLLDLMMPVLDGFGVLRAIQEKNIQVPVIVSSNLSQEDDIEKAKSFGAVDYYVKSDTPLSDVVDIVTKKITQ